MVGLPGGTTQLDGYIRGGHNRLDSLNFHFEHNGVQDSYRLFRLDPPDSINQLPLEWFATQFDSGTPGLKDLKLDGLVTFGESNHFGNRFAMSPIDRDHVRNNMLGAVPEPSSLTLLTGAGILFSLRRNRRI